MYCWRKFFSRFFALFLLVGTLALGATPSGEVVERVVAVVNGHPILLSELNEAIGRIEAQMKAQKKENELYQGDQLKKNVLEQMINDYLVQDEIKRMGLSVNDAMIDAAISSVMQENGMTSIDQLTRALKNEGMTLDEYRGVVKKQLENTRFMNEAIRPRVKVSDQDVDAALQREKASATPVSLAHIKMIYKSKAKGTNQKQMERLWRQIQAGIPFEQIANRETEGPGKGEGGNVGAVSPDQMQPELKGPVEKLKPGEVTGVIPTAKGFYIVMLVERVHEVPTDSESSKNEMRERLTRIETNKQFENLVQNLRTKAQIEVLL